MGNAERRDGKNIDSLHESRTTICILKWEVSFYLERANSLLNRTTNTAQVYCSCSGKVGAGTSSKRSSPATSLNIGTSYTL